MSQSNQNNNNNNNNSDHKDTKIFVGGLAWKSTADDLKSFFQQFGEIQDANVVYETYPQGRSKGYGFVIFKDPESAARACQEKFYVIDGRKASVNMASERPKPRNNNQPNQNGLLHQPGTSSHHYQNGYVNQTPPLHQYQQPIYPTQWYWAPQYYPHFHYQALHRNYHPTPLMINNHHYGQVNVTQHNWSHQTNNHQRPIVITRPPSRPVRITAPPTKSSSSSSASRNENIDKGEIKIINQKEISKKEVVNAVDNDDHELNHHHDQEDGQEEDNNIVVEVHQEIEDGSQENVDDDHEENSGDEDTTINQS